MNNEISLLEAVLNAYGIKTEVLDPPYRIIGASAYSGIMVSSLHESMQEKVLKAAEQLKEDEILILSGGFGESYGLFRSICTAMRMILIGPFCIDEMSKETAEKLEQDFGAAAAGEAAGWHRLLPHPPIRIMFRQLCDVLSLAAGGRQITVRFLSAEQESTVSHSESQSGSWQAFAESYIEERYKAENELIDLIAAGDEQKALHQMRKLMSFSFENRFSGSLRQCRHGLIIANTLMRKAAERAGVHPYHIDALSKIIAGEILNISEEAQRDVLLDRMVREYTRCVRQYAMKQFTAPVKETMRYINTHLDGDLSLMTLSGASHLSQSYLSNLFSRETGMTLTEYITRQRIFRAVKLLEKDNLSISETAERIGILDVNYFTKIFKKVTGMTPSRYRAFCHSGENKQ